MGSNGRGATKHFNYLDSGSDATLQLIWYGMFESHMIKTTISIHPCIHPSIHHTAIKVMMLLKSVPAASERGRGHTLDKWPFHHRATTIDNQSSKPTDYSESGIYLVHVSGHGEELRENTYRHGGRRLRKTIGGAIKPTSFLLCSWQRHPSL